MLWGTHVAQSLIVELSKTTLTWMDSPLSSFWTDLIVIVKYWRRIRLHLHKHRHHDWLMKFLKLGRERLQIELFASRRDPPTAARSKEAVYQSDWICFAFVYVCVCVCVCLTSTVPEMAASDESCVLPRVSLFSSLQLLLRFSRGSAGQGRQKGHFFHRDSLFRYFSLCFLPCLQSSTAIDKIG